MRAFWANESKVTAYYWRIDHRAWFWSSIYRICGFVLRKLHGYN